MLMHFYGLTIDDIASLTFPQYYDRLQDVAHITEYLQGEGKGRTIVDKEELARRMEKLKLRLPKKIRL